MVMDVRSQLREHMASKEEWTFSSEEEFSYALGQVVSFLISRSKANKITSSLANPIFTAKNQLCLIPTMENQNRSGTRQLASAAPDEAFIRGGCFFCRKIDHLR